MKFLTLVLFFLIQQGAMGQFYGHIKASPTAKYTSDHRYAHGRRLTKLMFELSQIAKLTDSKISYKYDNLKTFTVQSKTTSLDQNRERTVEKRTYTDSSCSYMKAVFTGGLNTTYEAWFDPYHSSDSIRITFDAKDQYLNQIEEIEASKNYLRLSNDSLVLTKGEFWEKRKQRKLFGKEFMTLDSEKMEINVVARYYRKKEHIALENKLKRLTLVKQNTTKEYKVCFYSDSIKINNELIPVDTSCLILSPGTTRFVFWENEEHKLSVLVKLDDSEEKLKIRSRIEEFHKGKWRKPKLKIRYFNERIPAGFTRWNTRYTVYHHPRIGETRTGSRIIRFFEDEDGNIIEVNGYRQFIWTE